MCNNDKTFFFPKNCLLFEIFYQKKIFIFNFRAMKKPITYEIHELGYGAHI